MHIKQSAIRVAGKVVWIDNKTKKEYIPKTVSNKKKILCLWIPVFEGKIVQYIDMMAQIFIY